MKPFTLLLFLMALTIGLRADHITGGEMYYTVSSRSNGTTTYQVTLKQFRSCATPNRNFYNPIYIAVFNRSTYAQVSLSQYPLSHEEQISYTSSDPCITRAPFVCYYVGYWNFSLTLPDIPEGYIITSQVTFRVDAITNLSPATTASAPLIPPRSPAPHNSLPHRIINPPSSPVPTW